MHRGNKCAQPIVLDPAYRIEFPLESSNLTNDQLREVEIDDKSLSERREAGDIVGFIFWRECIVHRSFVQTRGTAHMEGDMRAFTLAPGEMYVHYCYTAPNHRGKGLYPAMLRRIMSRSSANGESGKLFIACRTDNRPSIRSIQRAGFDYLRSSTVVGLGTGRLRLRWWHFNEIMSNGCLGQDCHSAGIESPRETL